MDGQEGLAVHYFLVMILIWLQGSDRLGQKSSSPMAQGSRME